MVNTLEYLYNTIVTDVIFIHDYIQIGIDNGGMSVYNPVFYKFNDVCSEIDKNFDISKLIGKSIIDSLFYENEYLSFVLDDMSEIKISLLPDDYTGPEALDINLKNGMIIVIN